MQKYTKKVRRRKKAKRVKTPLTPDDYPYLKQETWQLIDFVDKQGGKVKISNINTMFKSSSSRMTAMAKYNIFTKRMVGSYYRTSTYELTPAGKEYLEKHRGSFKDWNVSTTEILLRSPKTLTFLNYIVTKRALPSGYTEVLNALITAGIIEIELTKEVEEAVETIAFAKKLGKMKLNI